MHIVIRKDEGVRQVLMKNPYLGRGCFNAGLDQIASHQRPVSLDPGVVLFADYFQYPIASNMDAHLCQDVKSPIDNRVHFVITEHFHIRSHSRLLLLQVPVKTMPKVPDPLECGG
jgi:hypothetical protein